MESGIAMQTIDKEQLSGSRARSRTLFIALALLLGILAGCAGTTRVQPLAVPPEEVATVAPLGDGREGFVIREIPDLDATAVQDFEEAVVLMQAGDYDSAISLLENVVAAEPGVTAPYINLALACMHSNKPERAEEALQRALQLLPAHPVASNEYGLLLRKAGRFGEARAIYEGSLALFPVYSPLHKNLGILCDIYLQDLACALEHFESYSVVVPKDEQVKLWIADLHGRLGR